MILYGILLFVWCVPLCLLTQIRCFFLCKLQSGRYMQYILTWIFGMGWRMADSRNL